MVQDSGPGNFPSCNLIHFLILPERTLPSWDILSWKKRTLSRPHGIRSSQKIESDISLEMVMYHLFTSNRSTGWSRSTRLKMYAPCTKGKSPASGLNMKRLQLDNLISLLISLKKLFPFFYLIGNKCNKEYM